MRTTLASLVDDWRRLGGETAVVAHRGNRAFRTSYRELARLAGRFAAELDARQVDAGERVVLWGENSPEWMAVFFGCTLRGVLAVPLDAAGSAKFAARVVDEVRPRLLVGDASLLRQLGGGTERLELSRLHEELPAEPTFEVSEAVTEDAPFQIVFTSGTTSEPKGVVHTHRNVLASLRPIEAEIGRYRRYERLFHPLRFLHTLPFSHVFGQFMGLWIPALLGAEIHLPANVEPGRIVATIKRERISVVVAVPRILELLRDHLRTRFPGLQAELARNAGISAWQRWWRFRSAHRALGFKFWAFICGGATLPVELEAFWNGLGFALVQGYGMTETAALVTLNHPFKVGKGTLGKALPGREVRLSSDGEILVRGDVLAAGTWAGGQYRPRTDEWLATGDLATQEPGGDLRFAGRRGDVIVTAAGLNVFPADLEGALLKQAGVRACAVVACDAGSGPEPVAVVVFAGDEEELRGVLQQANGELAPYQGMRQVLRWPEPRFPYTSTGKLLRREIAAWATAQGLGDRRGGSGVDDALLVLVEEITRRSAGSVDDASRLTEDLHLDSLGRVQLQSALEQRFGVEIRNEQMTAIETLGELRALSRIPAAGEAFARPDRPVQPGVSLTPIVADAGSSSRRVKFARWPWSRPVQWVRAAFVELVAMPLVWLLAKPKVVWEQSEQSDEPMLLIANHVSTYDVPLLLYALQGRRRRWVATAMSAEVLEGMRAGRGQGSIALNLFARAAYWLVVALFNVFPLPRSSGFRESFAHAGEALDRGYSVLVFPEGRRGWTGELQSFRPGIGLLVRASQVPVLPIALQGMGAAGRGSRRWFRPAKLTVHVGRPVELSPNAAPEDITTQLEAALRALGPS